MVTSPQWCELSADTTPSPKTHSCNLSESHSQDALLETLARAAFDATSVSFHFDAAHMQRLGKNGHVRDVLTDADCIALRAASGLRVFTNDELFHFASCQAMMAPSREHGKHRGRGIDSGVLLSVDEEDAESDQV